MTDDELIETLKEAAPFESAVDAAELLARIRGSHSQSALAMYFKRAFPAIPLRVLLEAGAWHRVSNGRMTDDEFNNLLGPWLHGVSP
jgi:hypothetical protein